MSKNLCNIDTWGIYYKTLRNVQQKDRFCRMQLSYIINHKYTIYCDKQTTLLSTESIHSVALI
jgi:hypothetical protein